MSTNGFDAPDYLTLVEHEKLSDSQKLDAILANTESILAIMAEVREVVNAVRPKVEDGLAQVGPLVTAIENMPLVRSLVRMKK